MAALYWQALEHTRLSASAARKVRFPTMENLHSLSAGNADLTGETSEHFELGLEQGFGLGSLEIYAYETRANDYIAKDVDGVYANVGDYRFRGIDSRVQLALTESLDLGLSYSYLDSEDDTPGSTEGLQYRPKHQYGVTLDYRLPTDTRLHLDWQRVVDQIYFVRSGKQNGSPSIA